MGDSNLACVLKEKGVLSVEEFPQQKPGSGEVKLAMDKVGICGSDVHFWKKGFIGDFVIEKPMILGHESAGTVSELGEGVTNLKVGDRVAIEPGVPCRMCEFCKTGRYNLCLDVLFLSAPPVDGSLCNFHVHAADFCFKLPDHISLEEGALLEPLSVAVHACKTGRVSLGDKVLVCGAGPIGLLHLLTAKAMGAATVCMTDIDADRLQFAKTLGASCTVLVDDKDTKAVADEIVQTMGGNPDISMECSGVESSVGTAIYATKSGGMLVLIGIGQPEMKIPILHAAFKEVTIQGINRYVNCYPIALSMIASGQIDIKPLITHRFTLEESLKAFEVASTGAGGAIKVIIDCAKK